MTLPDERYRAVIYTRRFLYDLLDPCQTPRVPTKVRRYAGVCLRHFPHESEMERAAAACPTVFKVER